MFGGYMVEKDPRKDKDEEQTPGYYTKGGAFYSANPEKIFDKLRRLDEDGKEIDLVFKGDLVSELENSINNPDETKRIDGIKNVLSFGLMELRESIGTEDFQKKVKDLEVVVDCLLNKYKDSFFLLFTKEHDSSTIIHSLNVMAIATQTRVYVEENFPNDDFLKMGTLQEFALAGLLHDMGKVYMEDIVKKTEKLSDEDWDRIRKHPEDGYEILKKAGIESNKILNAVLYHHRRLNGGGYPALRIGDEINRLTYLIGTIDSIEAMVSRTRRHNADKEKLSMREVVRKLLDENSKNFSLPSDFIIVVSNALLASDYKQRSQTTN